MATEHLKCGWVKQRCAVNIKYMLDFEGLVLKKFNTTTFLFTIYRSVNILDKLG